MKTLIDNHAMWHVMWRPRLVWLLAGMLILWGGVSAGWALPQDLRTPRAVPTQGHGFTPGYGQGGAPSIQAMVMTPNHGMYAGTFGMGIFRSPDQGASWEVFNQGLRDHFILCLTADADGTVYVGTVRGGVFRTNPDHTKWEPISQGLKRVEIKSLLSNEHGLFAGTGRGVYQWVEDDHQWKVVAEGLDQILVASVVMMPNKLMLAGTAGKGLLGFDPTSPGAKEWKSYAEFLVDPIERLEHRFIRIVAVGPGQEIYVGTQNGGIFMSADGGRSWKAFGRSLPNHSIRSIVPTAAGVFVATGRGVFKKTHESPKWISVNHGLSELSIQVLIHSPEGVLYAGTSSGAFRSADLGNHWDNISEGFGPQLMIPGPYQR